MTPDEVPAGTPRGGVFAVAAGLIPRLAEQQGPAIAAAATTLASRLMAGGTVYVFGTGHSRLVAMEMAARAGGLAGVKELALEDLVERGQATRAEIVDGTLERRPEAALALLEPVLTGSADAFLVVSHSGRNGAPVEMAVQAKTRGLPVVAITSLAASRAMPSRHPSGARLFEVADLVIDTLAPYGDTAIVAAPGVGVCSISSFAGVVIAQALTVEVVARYLAAGTSPPVLQSRNLP
ncbi:MAG TPA: sugar isomerase domain-containing protein [Acidimicrobiales bacterium]|nr:sugar isomerase domain-containing protein [Acidimicrobiales bacterium]